MKKLIVIAGPTASGKTSLSVRLAKKLKAPVISADSRQFYKELSIGTARPSLEEMDGVPHYFVGTHSVETPLAFGEYEIEAVKLIEELFESHDNIILTGGSGMFISSVIFGTDQLPYDPKLREKWHAALEEKGLEYLQEQLKKVDPAHYEKVDLNNPVRIIRALEVYDITQTPYSELRQTKKTSYRFNTHYIVIDHPREVLYDRINQRVDQMMQSGLLEEVRRNSHYRHLQALNTVGYSELFDFLDEKTSLEEAIELIKRNTRRYAKRQLTWFRKIEDAHWLEAKSTTDMLEEVLALIS